MSTDRPLRVAITSPYSLTYFGGVQLQVLGLARALRSIGVDARVVAPSDGPPPAPGIMTVGPTFRFPSNGSIAPIASGRATAARTLEALRVFGPDVVHLHEPLSPSINHAVLVGTALPVVGTFHAAHPGRNAWYDAFRLPLKAMVDRLEVCTAVSEEAQRNVQAFGVQCEILPNGVDVEEFTTAEPWPSPRPAIFFIGRHEPRKGLGVLLDAFAALERDAVLWVAGEGGQTADLQARGVPSVEWLGTIGEVEKARRFRGATIACFPSVEGESFGIVLLEAMAARAAVVASDLTGYRNVARDGQEAVLVTPDDATRLGDALRAVLDDPARLAALVAAGTTRAAEFSMARLAESFIERYEAAISARRHPSGVAAQRPL